MKVLGSKWVKSTLAILSGFGLLAPLKSTGQTAGNQQSNENDLSANEIAVLASLSKNGELILDQDNQVLLDEARVIEAIRKVVSKLNATNSPEHKDVVLKKLVEKMKYGNYKVFHKGAAKAQAMSFSPN